MNTATDATIATGGSAGAGEPQVKLCAVRSEEELTAAGSVAWFCSGVTGREIIGYAMSAHAATWVRIGSDGTLQHCSDAGDPLADAYELELFDGERELRWLHTAHGRGTAVALGEEPTALPTGSNLLTGRCLRRGDSYARALAGRPEPGRRSGWCTLRGARYAKASLPCVAAGDQLITIESVEYLVEDDYGNVDVAETRTVGLRPVPAASLRTRTDRIESGRQS